MAHICHLRLKNLCLSNFILVRTYSTSEIFTFVSTCTLFYICLVHLYMSCTFRSEQSSCSGWRTARRCMFSNSNGVRMCRTKVIEFVRFCCNLQQHFKGLFMFHPGLIAVINANKELRHLDLIECFLLTNQTLDCIVARIQSSKGRKFYLRAKGIFQPNQLFHCFLIIIHVVLLFGFLRHRNGHEGC